MERYAAEYKEAFDNNEIDEKLFWPDELKRLKAIVADPKAYVNELRNSKDGKSELDLAREKGKMAVFSYYLKEEGLASALKRGLSSICR